MSGSGGDVQSPTPLECDVGLGLNTEPAYPYKKTSFMSHHQNRHYHHPQASEYAGVYSNTNRIASGFPFKSTTGSSTVGVMAASGKLLFTATQWQELERQTMIFKYMMASIPVPPQLLLPLSTQSNRGGMGLKFSNGSDPEPWRCRRTDGKKWRCSKDVAPDQKYCERHAHKTRPRSRKPVEIQPHNNKEDYHPLLLSSHVNNIKNYKNPSDWFMRNGTIPVSKSESDQIFKPDFKGNFQHKSYLDHNLNTSGTSTAASDAAAGARRQDFIDSWSGIGNGDDCSLSLSMQSGGNGMKFEDDESFQMGVGMLDGDTGGCGDVFRSHHHQWLNQPSWAGSTPGGPLGEVLCLGIASTTNMAPNVPSPHGYSNNTTTSSSCEGGDVQGHGFNR
ncbi:growth-regulating factor 8-like isoform X1 [Cynara cardunculus var. scolymus]|uniref:growth-regulating factor 8-like isoform X1 n=1 Tax=Cynara cardunculus var. scolymus TaxID=59895 RepID=UPI000D623CB5|nr:growth-regulating factor 8-like isoform X1 [Cynara cardunculus var. scolymus]